MLYVYFLENRCQLKQSLSISYLHYDDIALETYDGSAAGVYLVNRTTIGTADNSNKVVACNS